jgi:hypothetical protein
MGRAYGSLALFPSVPPSTVMSHHIASLSRKNGLKVEDIAQEETKLAMRKVQTNHKTNEGGRRGNKLTRDGDPGFALIDKKWKR